MRIKRLQKEYIQKSSIFLYPHLRIKKGVTIIPIQTYMSWTEHYDVTDCKLICVYDLRRNKEFKAFEKKFLKGNQYYESSHKLNKNTIVYVFDFSSMKKDYQKVCAGKYSKLSLAFKIRISEFFQTTTGQHSYVLTYLVPNLFMDDYATLLGIDEELLHEVGELCSPPNKDLENLKL